MKKVYRVTTSTGQVIDFPEESSAVMDASNWDQLEIRYWNGNLSKDKRLGAVRARFAGGKWASVVETPVEVAS